MKTIQNITGSESIALNLIAVVGLTAVTAAITLFTIFALSKGINPF